MFDEMEVGRWYWGRDHIGNWHRFECVQTFTLEKVLRHMETNCKWFDCNVTDITPVPSRETWEACVAALEAADNELWRIADPDSLAVHKQVRAALAKARGE